MQLCTLNVASKKLIVWVLNTLQCMHAFNTKKGAVRKNAIEFILNFVLRKMTKQWMLIFLLMTAKKLAEIIQLQESSNNWERRTKSLPELGSNFLSQS